MVAIGDAGADEIIKNGGVIAEMSWKEYVSKLKAMLQSGDDGATNLW